MYQRARARAEKEVNEAGERAKEETMVAEEEAGRKRRRRSRRRTRRQVKMAMKVKKAAVGRVRMLERPPRSDEGQLGQSIPQAGGGCRASESEKGTGKGSVEGNGGRRMPGGVEEATRRGREDRRSMRTRG